jgi:hypothetical protein
MMHRAEAVLGFTPGSREAFRRNRKRRRFACEYYCTRQDESVLFTRITPEKHWARLTFTNDVSR